MSAASRTPTPDGIRAALDEHWDEVDFARIHHALSHTYWAEGIPAETLRRAMRGSLNQLMRDAAGQVVGYARVITDGATFAYLCDVYVLESLRGRGLGDWMIGRVLEHPSLQGLRRFQLVTRDAHALYARHGFQPLSAPERGMEILRPGLYLKPSPQGASPDADSPH